MAVLRDRFLGWLQDSWTNITGSVIVHQGLTGLSVSKLLKAYLQRAMTN